MDSAENAFGFNSLSFNAASESTQISNTEIANKKLYLSSKSDPEFRIPIDAKTIEACEILRSVLTFTETPDSDAIEVDMSPKQLCKFVELHEHFSLDDPWDKEDPEWVCKFFGEFSDSDFKDFCWKADYLDSERFLANATFYLHKKLEGMKLKKIRKFLNIIDDYTDVEKSAMYKCHLEYLVNLTSKEQIPFHPQNFALPKSLMNFAFSASKIRCHIFLKRLYKTCKYFFGTMRLIPCVEILIFREVHLYDKMCQYNVISVPLKKVNKLNATFFIMENFSLHENITFRECHQFLKRIIWHEKMAVTMDYKNLTLTLEEFKFLFSKVTHFYFYNVKVFDSEGSEVPVEELLKYLPKVTSFGYQNSSPRCVTPKTMQNLIAFARDLKFCEFCLKGPESFRIDKNAFDLFVNKHANPNGRGGFYFMDWLETSKFVKKF